MLRPGVIAEIIDPGLIAARRPAKQKHLVSADGSHGMTASRRWFWGRALLRPAAGCTRTRALNGKVIGVLIGIVIGDADGRRAR